ncbi:hypothetical protein [Embleya sp. NPDC020630]|uniref:hypothetical protein n=1 Tax=Embleya sp. NPDC020630 TaxID=3363979 RepID=UPI0037A7BB8F
MRDGTVHNGAVWAASDAPVGDGPGLSRDVFGFAGRAVSTGLAAVVYAQQEPATSGYGTAVGHEKRQTRVLVACGTSGPAPTGGSANRSYLAAVDFAVARDGRLATAPSLVALTEAGKPTMVGDAAAVAAAQAAVDAARASLDKDRQVAAQIPQTQANIGYWEGMFGYAYVSFSGWYRQLQEQQAAQQRLGARQAALDTAEDALVTVSGGTRGGGDTVVAMPVVSTDRQGLTVCGALLAFAWTEDAPFLLDGTGGDVVLYFRGGAGQFFSAYYSTLVTRATRSLGAGADRLEFVARDTATRAKDFTVRVAADAGSAADLCTVTVTCGSRTETYLRVPRAAASLAAVLNGNPPTGTLLGIVLSVKDRLVELTAPLSAPLAVGSLVLVGGRVRKIDAAAPAGATTFTVAGDPVTAAAGSQVTAALYDYADATAGVTGTDLSSGSRIVAVTRVGSTAAVVADGDAKDAGDGVGPHWRGHAPGRAPAFDGTTQYLTAVNGADFGTDGDLTLEAWLNPASATGTVLRAAGPATPYGLALRGTTLSSGISFEEDNVIECGDRLTLTGISFSIEMWVFRQAVNREDLVFSTGLSLLVGIDSSNRFLFGGDFGTPGRADLDYAVTTATVPA